MHPLLIGRLRDGGRTLVGNIWIARAAEGVYSLATGWLLTTKNTACGGLEAGQDPRQRLVFAIDAIQVAARVCAGRAEPPCEKFFTEVDAGASPGLVPVRRIEQPDSQSSVGPESFCWR